MEKHTRYCTEMERREHKSWRCIVTNDLLMDIENYIDRNKKTQNQNWFGMDGSVYITSRFSCCKRKTSYQFGSGKNNRWKNSITSTRMFLYFHRIKVLTTFCDHWITASTAFCQIWFCIWARVLINISFRSSSNVGRISLIQHDIDNRLFRHFLSISMISNNSECL